MPMQEELPFEYNVGLDHGGMQMFYDHLNYAIENWPGAPKRPVEEQEFLKHLKQNCFQAMLEHNFDLPSQKRDGATD